MTTSPTDKSSGKPTGKPIGKTTGTTGTPLPSIPALIGEGVAAIRRYKGLASALYAIQFISALILTWAVSALFATAFANQPMFDLAVDGDLSALIFLFTDAPHAFTAVLYLVCATVIGYWLLSWFLIGGLNAVLIERPGSRADVIRQFGSGGTRTFFAYARLTLLSLIPYAIISAILMFGMSSAATELRYGLTLSEVFLALTPRLAPGLLLLLLHGTAVDYARIELSRTIGLASRHALLRSYRAITSDWRPLVHALTYIGFFACVSLVYTLGTQGSPMHGALGAIFLFFVRQLLSAARFAGKLICAGGQVVYLDARNRDEGPRKRLPVVQ